MKWFSILALVLTLGCAGSPVMPSGMFLGRVLPPAYTALGWTVDSRGFLIPPAGWTLAPGFVFDPASGRMTAPGAAESAELGDPSWGWIIAK